ncbi:MAG: Co2+/Mg2+ efflux protein ApaG [Candidatus Thioglobus sp.]|nr:Co2+/Mg2+ efflux protein ApaG [Candidatus Thioglobus sp.]
MKNDIKIEIRVLYLENQSNIAQSQYAFAYTITITNQGEIGAQLLARHWLIMDENGHIEEVLGEGVVGQKPHLLPGESFQYSSGALIKTPTGSMKGTYGMISDEGERFEALIPEFVLSEPYTLH